MKELQLSCLQDFPSYDEGKVRTLFINTYQTLPKGLKIIVLDDDPTGIQTVHDISVYTAWDEDSIERGFAETSHLFFILTNSRSLSSSQTKTLHENIAETISKVSKKTGKPFIVLSRSDSTLRGHYPLETETIKETLEKTCGYTFDGEIIMPFFLEGGRYTIDDVHYVRQEELLIPAAQTEFANDKTFGYHESNLKEWCEEKTNHQVKASEVIGIELEDLRTLHIEKIKEQIESVNHFGKIIVNAIDYCDVKVFTIAFIQALSSGKHYLFRCAASIVKVLGGVSDRPLLQRNELINQHKVNGGIVIAGSHVKKTTQQLEQLKEIPSLKFIEFNQHLVLQKQGLENEALRVSRLMNEYISQGKNVVVYTRRQRIDFPNNDPDANLAMAVEISDALTSLVSSLTYRPSFIIAKGGITSSDIGTKALGVRKAKIMGQVLPGVPVWMTGPESKFPNLPYIIFPGNVGDIDALKKVVEILIS